MVHIKGLLKHTAVPIFGWNPIKIYKAIIDFLYEKRSKICHTYMVNHWKELDETWHVDGVTIVGVPFCSLNKSEKDHRDMTQNPISVKLHDQICE